MEGPTRGFSLFQPRRGKETPREEERRALREGMERTRTQLHQAYHHFNQERDPDLIDSYVFEINALQSRYTYLARRAKALEQNREEGL